MTYKQWFNNVLHLHPVHEEGAEKRKPKIITVAENTKDVLLTVEEQGWMRLWTIIKCQRNQNISLV